jgi:hypothetical protein
MNRSSEVRDSAGYGVSAFEADAPVPTSAPTNPPIVCRQQQQQQQQPHGSVTV